MRPARRWAARDLRAPSSSTSILLAADWSPGQAINVLGHAVNVPNTLVRHTPDAPPQVVAACLLHAIPQWPMADEAVHELVESQCGVEARLLLEALRDEQALLAVPLDHVVEGHLRLLRMMSWLAHATLAFKIVEFQCPSGRPAVSAWRPFASLGDQVPYLRQLHDFTAGVVPQTMSSTYLRLMEQCLPMTSAAATR